MKITIIRTALAVTALVLAASACGSDDEATGGATADAAAEEPAATTADATEATDATTAPAATEAPDGDKTLAVALADNMMEEAATGGGPVSTREEADCWANAIVDGIGEGRLNEMGVTPDSIGEIDELPLDDGEISVVVDSLFECSDVQATFASQFASGFGEEAAACVAEGLDEEVLKEIFASELRGTEPSAELFTQVQELATGCGVGA